MFGLMSGGVSSFGGESKPVQTSYAPDAKWTRGDTVKSVAFVSAVAGMFVGVFFAPYLTLSILGVAVVSNEIRRMRR